jgi:hypothetical protein
MTVWLEARLRQIAAADDLHIAPLRADGVTPGTPTWIWSVAVDGELYVRAYHGHSSRWYQAALAQQAGCVTAAGLTETVGFSPVNGSVNDLIDDAYRVKYRGNPYLDSMISERARSATIKITPCDV